MTLAPQRAVPGSGADRAEPPVALYVHVPFCVARCPYCDFVVLPGAAARGPRNRVADYVDALLAELRLRAPASPVGLRSVYVGGGTPSLLPVADVMRLLDAVDAAFGIADGAEVTLEVNPGRDERGEPRAWREAGVTRLSFGAQSLDASELRALGRRHSPEDVLSAVTDARRAGITSISVDLLYDVPGQSAASWARTLDGALALDADHLSLYALTLDDAVGADHLPLRPGARRWRERARAGQDEDRAADQYALAEDRLAAAGYRHYEISNWARPGHASRHNLAYWWRLPHEAVGPGAHAFDGATRRWNDAAFEPWLAALAAGTLPPGGSEWIDDEAANAERLILGLRLAEGIPVPAAAAPGLAWGIDTGLLEAAGDRLRLTRRGRLLSNEVFARLL
ncbi:MAG: radical SAM family heme chaperone HemW [Chloroflexi bacterium]|nr:radical SAM family heme chaperone HemW [Chloroflexota bacterium]